MAYFVLKRLRDCDGLNNAWHEPVHSSGSAKNIASSDLVWGSFPLAVDCANLRSPGVLAHRPSLPAPN